MANGLSISEFKEPGKYDRAELFIAKINGKAKDENKKPNVLFKRRDKEQFFEIEIDSITGKEAWNKKPIAFDDIPSGGNSGRIYKVKGKNEFLLLSEIEKTAEFGSSSGSGGGADATAATESMCCYFASYLLQSGKASLTQIEDKKDLLMYVERLSEFFKDSSKSKFVEAFDKSKRLSFDDCYAHWSKKSEAEWMYTFISTANIIKKNSKKFEGDVYFHRGSPFMDLIYEKKKKCEQHNKDLVKSGDAPNSLKEGLQSISDDKWNPGDIWMSTKKPTEEPFSYDMKGIMSSMKTHICDWPSLQQAVYNSAINGETVGISLKKAGKSASLRFFNSKNPETKKQPIRYNGYTFGSGDFFNSADVYIEFNSGRMQFRPFGTTKSWQGEIKGTKASGGKAGGGAANYYAELMFGRSIDHSTKKDSGTWQEYKGIIGDNATKLKIWNRYKVYNKGQKTKKNPAVKIKLGAEPNPLVQLSKDFKRTKDAKFHYYTFDGTKTEVSFKDFLILGDNFTNSKKQLSPESFYFGKYMGLALVDIIESGSSENQKGFATEIVRFAMSNIDNVSSFYWKVF